MKKYILIILVISLFSINTFAQKYYQEFGKTRIQSESEIELKEAVLFQKFSTKYPDVIIDFNEVDEKIINDSTILIYKLVLKLNSNASLNLSSSEEAVFSMINKSFPNFNLSDINGKNYSMKELKGKPIVFNFWFTGCGPCKKEMPVLNKIRNNYKDKVEFISITFNSKIEVQETFSKHRFDFIKLVNARKLIDKLGISAYPKTIFVDKNGVITQIYEKVDEIIDSKGNVVFGNGDEIRKEIEKIL